MRRPYYSRVNLPTPEVPKCDFCSARPVRWRYPAVNIDPVKSVSVPGVLMQSSMGDWAACDICHGMIEKGQWLPLAERSLAALAPSQQQRVSFMVMIQAIHQNFREARKVEGGVIVPAVPMG